MFIELCNLGIEILFLSSVATTDGKDGHGLKALPKLHNSINILHIPITYSYKINAKLHNI